jgi:uncharacterized protein YbjT (DUF2867 family)
MYAITGATGNTGRAVAEAGIMKPTEKRSAANTTPTSIEEFAKSFAAAYNGTKILVYF